MDLDFRKVENHGKQWDLAKNQHPSPIELDIMNKEEYFGALLWKVM